MKINTVNIFALLFATVSLLASCSPDPFSQINISEKELPSSNLVCVEYFGSYDKTQPLIDSLEQDLKARGVVPSEYFGIFYNDPNKNVGSQLHSIVGCVMPPKDTIRIRELGRRGYRIEPIGKTQCMVAEFDYFSGFPIVVGIEKVYTAFEKYISEKGYQKDALFVRFGSNKIMYSMEIRTK